MRPPGLRQERVRQGRTITLRQVAPNAVTAMALCFGLTAMRYAMSAEWERAVTAIVLAGVLDGLDGRIARILHGESRFGAELDSLSDVIAFGVSPAIVLYLWSLSAMPRFGWLGALALALCCALRLARFNASIDLDDQPMKSAGFNMGVPAPVGAGLALLPVYLWFSTGWDWVRDWRLVLAWAIAIAFLMVSSVATLGWKRMRVPPSMRLFAIGGAGVIAALLLTSPWPTLLTITAGYVALLPYGWIRYATIRRQRERARAGGA